MLINDMPQDGWSPPLACGAGTVFQVHQGAVMLDLGGAAESTADGLILTQDDRRPLRDTFVLAGAADVRFRRIGKRRSVLYLFDPSA